MSETNLQENDPIPIETIQTNDQEQPVKIKPMRLNRTHKKLLKFERKRANARQKKEDKKLAKKLENVENMPKTSKPTEFLTPYVKTEGYLNHRDLKNLKKERIRQVYKDSSNSLKICIDCSFSENMSNKEMSRLAQQIGRCHASNKSLESPVHLTLCNLDNESLFYKELCRRNDGFIHYIIEQTDKTIEAYYENNMDRIAYMSPDSPSNLEAIDVNTTYVIGGLVDESVSKNATINKCTDLKINAYSLPIERYMSRQELSDGVKHFKVFNYSKILAINQVFDILADFFVNKDWPRALECGVPKRKGFCIKEEKKLMKWKK